MATGSQILAAGMNNIVNTANTRYNQILSFLIQQESISPGNLTALINQIDSERVAISMERRKIQGFEEMTVEQENDLRETIKQIQGRREVANLNSRTKMSEARTKIETAILEGEQTQQGEARTRFNRATTASDYNKNLQSYQTRTPTTPADAQTLVKDHMMQFYDNNLAQGRSATAGMAVATAEYDDLIEQEILDAGETNKQLGGLLANVDYQKAVKDAQTELGIGQVSGDEAIQQYRAEGNALAAKVGTRGITSPQDNAALITLGFDNPDALVPTRTFDPRNYEAKLGRAAFNSRLLEEDAEIQEQYAAFGTFADFEDTLMNVNDPDHKVAQTLYNDVLFRSTGIINALADGQYPRRLLAIRDRERDLAVRQGKLDEMLDKKEKGETRGIEDLTMEANRIYNNLYGIRKGKASRQDIEALDTLFQGKTPQERAVMLDELPYSDRQKKRIGNVLERGAMKNIKELKEVMSADEPLALDLQNDNWANTDIVTTITNEAGQDVLVGKVTQVPVTDWTLSDLYQEVKESLDPRMQQVTEDVIEVYNNAAMDGSLSPRLSRELGALADGLATEVGGIPKTLPDQASVTPTPTTPVMMASAAPPPMGDLAMLDMVGEEPTNLNFAPTDIGGKQPGGSMSAMELGVTGQVASDSIAAQLKNSDKPLTLAEYKTATDAATDGSLKETIGDDATAIVMKNKDTLEEYGRLVQATGGSINAEDLYEIVPEGRTNNNVRLGLQMIARNGMQIV